MFKISESDLRELYNLLDYHTSMFNNLHKSLDAHQDLKQIKKRIKNFNASKRLLAKFKKDYSL